MANDKGKSEIDQYKEYIKRLLETQNYFDHFVTKTTKSTPHPISKEIDIRERELKNKAFEQDMLMKKNTLVALFIFLGVETIAIFTYTFFQATYSLNFKLEEWSFKLLVSATITQITVMLLIAVRHLFPDQK